MTQDHLEKWTEYCQRVLNNPKWYPWRFEVVPQGIACSGAECPLTVRGKRKGQPNYRKANMNTKTTIIFPVEKEGI